MADHRAITPFPSAPQRCFGRIAASRGPTTLRRADARPRDLRRADARPGVPCPAVKSASVTTPKFCPSCRARFGTDALFCPNDGTPLLAAPTSDFPSANAGEQADPYLGREISGHIEIRQLAGVGAMGRGY